ncbi:hypothetical protein NJB93_20480 [Brucella intermedia]|uniref:hypothetical protein n=1 Tax=Brucella intermedia TaxID=94625 RepID=UPI00209B5CC8|nr:hypothetical protein [Brucella intermedia]MCO7728945.1 hypothetical protein [Brucella intermedia]
MQEIDWFAEISKYIGIVVAAGGGGAAVVFGVFQAWGKGWLDNHFNRRLEEFKHEQTKEIERMKLKVSTVFDRSVRLHQLEFEALPTLWEKLFEAYKECAKFIAPFRQYADIARMNNEKLTSYLVEIGYSKIEIEIINDSDDKEQSFVRLTEIKNFNKASDTYNSFREYFQKKSVFLDKDLKDKIDSISALTRAALYEQHDNLIERYGKMERSNIKAFQDRANGLMDEIEALVKQRLWDATTAQV